MFFFSFYWCGLPSWHSLKFGVRKCPRKKRLLTGCWPYYPSSVDWAEKNYGPSTIWPTHIVAWTLVCGVGSALENPVDMYMELGTQSKNCVLEKNCWSHDVGFQSRSSIGVRPGHPLVSARHCAWNVSISYNQRAGVLIYLFPFINWLVTRYLFLCPLFCSLVSISRPSILPAYFNFSAL